MLFSLGKRSEIVSECQFSSLLSEPFWAAIQRRGSILSWKFCLFMVQTQLQLVSPCLR
jgi:hypothetical protein